MKIAICDDNLDFGMSLKAYINEFFAYYNLDCVQIDVFETGEALLASKFIYDIAFLDVEMKGLSGIYTGRELRYKNKDIIFFIVTAYDEYIDEAFRFHAFRYLTKPINKQRLFRNLKDALYIYNTHNRKIAIETKELTYTVKSSSIIMLETEDRRVIIHTTTADYVSVYNISYWDNTLNQLPFFKTHKSYIVNLEHVISFNNSIINLNGNYTAYLTLRRHNEFKKVYLTYLDVTS